jgi:hypothetical protein
MQMMNSAGSSSATTTELPLVGVRPPGETSWRNPSAGQRVEAASGWLAPRWSW